MAKKIELLHTTYDESGNIESQEVVHPLTSPDCIIMENGKTLDEVMGDGIATPTLTHEGTSFKVGVGDSNIEVVDGDVAGMTLKGQSYQNILPKPTTLIMETDEKEFKINDKIDSNIIIDDNIAEIATVKGKTIVNAVQEESASEYTVLGENLSGQSIIHVKETPTLEGSTLTNKSTRRVFENCKPNNGTGIDGVKGGTIYLITFIATVFNSQKSIVVQSYGASGYLENSPRITYVVDTNNKVTLTVRLHQDANRIVLLNPMESDSLITLTDIMCIEYQEGMENWDIPYFEGTKTFENNIKGVTLQGQTLVNTIQEPCKDDYVVLGAEDGIEISAETGGHGTIEDTVQGGINGAILKGQTLVNLIDTENGYGMRFTHDSTVDGDCYTVTTMSHGQKVVVNQAPSSWRYFAQEIKLQMLKPRTKYFVSGEFQGISTFQFMEANATKPISIHGDVINNRYAIIETSGDLYGNITSQCLYGHISTNIDSGSVLMCNDVILVEYQEGMENWDIPYFEGMKSVQMPVLKTVGKNLFDYTHWYSLIYPLFDYEIVGDKISTTIPVGWWFLETNQIDFSELKMNTVYTMSGSPVNSEITILFWKPDGAFIFERGVRNTPITFRTPNEPFNVSMRFCRRLDSDNTVEVQASCENIQIEEGSTATSYEPYQSSTVTTEKNLFDGILTPDYLTDSTGQPSGLNGSLTHSRHTPSFIPIQANEKFRIRATSDGSTTTGDGRVYFYDKDYNYLNIYVTSLEAYTNTFSMDVINTVPNNSNIAYMRVRFFNGFGVQADSVQINKVYELRKVGEVKDELDLLTGELTQRIGEAVYTEKESWYQYLDNEFDDSSLFSCISLKIGDTSDSSMKTNFISDRFTPSMSIYVNNIIGSYIQNGSLFIRVKKEWLTTPDVYGLQKYLQQNPITVQYPLATESIKTVDLSIVDQDGNTIPHIQTQPTVTHITASSDYLIPTVTIDNNLTYDTIIKPSTTYTVRFKRGNVNADNPLIVDLGGTTQVVTSTEFTITTPSELTHNQLVFSGKNNVVSEVQVIEGDMTNIEYPFFEGMNDVNFSDSKFIGRGKNLVRHLPASSYYSFNIQEAQGSSTIINGSLTADYRDYYIVGTNENTHVMDYFNKMKVGETIHFNSNIKDFAHHIAIGKPKQNTTYVVNKYTKQSQDEVLLSMFIRFTKDCSFNNNELQIQIEIGSTATSYEPYRGVEVQQDVDIIPLTSDMFEQGNITSGKIVGMSYQQLNHNTETVRVKSKTLIPIKPNGKYIIQSLNKTNNRLWGWQYDKNGGYLSSIGNTDEIDVFQFDSKAHYITFVLCNQDDSTITPSDLNSMNLILQEVPQEIVLRGIGDVKDELNLTRGEYIQRIGEIKFNECQYDFSQEVIPNSCAAILYPNLAKQKISSYNLKCDKLPTVGGIVGDVAIYENPGNIVIFDKTISSQQEFIQKYNDCTIQYVLATPIIHKVNLTNTKVIPSYTTETHYETITPSDSLIPNITIPSTLNYNVTIKPSTEYTIRANTSDNLTVDLGGATGTLSNGKVTLTTPATLTHNEVKFSGTGKVKELMVVEGNEIKDNVPFFNGMKNVEMGGIKLVNIARGATCNNLVTANTNKTQFTFTGNDYNWGVVTFNKSLLKANTTYTVYLNVVSAPSDSNGGKFQFGDGDKKWFQIDAKIGMVKGLYTTTESDLSWDGGFDLRIRPFTSGQQIVIQNPMIIEGDWTHLDEIPFIESEMIIEQPIIRSQGKNLFDISRGINYTWHSEYTINGDGSVSVMPTIVDGVAYVQSEFFFLEVGKTYTVSWNASGNAHASFVWLAGTTNSPYDTSNTFTVVEGKNKLTLAMYVDTSSLENVATFKPQIEEGSTATTYEPYKHQTLYSNRVIGYEDGCYYAWDTGTKTSSGAIASVISDVEGLNVAYVTHASSNFSFYDKDGAYLSGSMYLSTATSSNADNNFDRFGFITIPANAKYMKMACGNANTAAAKDYHLKATVTGELPLRSLPNGVCDTLNLVTGEYVQRVGEVVLDGRENWINGVESQNTGKTIYFGTYSFDSLLLKNGSITSDKFNKGDTWSGDSECIDLLSTNAYNLRVRLSKTRLVVQDVNGFKEWLSQNPITVQYELETPIVRKLGFTAKGNYREQVLDGREEWHRNGTQVPHNYYTYPEATYKTIYNENIITMFNDSDVFPTSRSYTYERLSTSTTKGFSIVINPSRLNGNTIQKYLAANAITVGFVNALQSSESYSNIHKPIFFNNVNVQFLPQNLDIQPQLTYQVRTRNSYVMDMMKPNTKYSIKLLSSSGNMLIDGTSYTLANNRTFVSPSTLTNKELIITGQWHEPMIIEGDVTAKNLPYFKGILSSYHDVDEIEVYSVNKNLFDMSKVKPYEGRATYWWNTIVKENEVVSVRIGDINNGQFGAYIKLNVRPNSVYTLYIEMEKDGEPFNGQIYGYENGDLWGNGTFTGYANTPYHINTSHNAKYITIGFNYGKDLPIGTTLVSKNMRLYLGEESPVYIPHAHNTTLIEMPTRLETVKVVRPVMEKGCIINDDGTAADSPTEKRLPFIPVQPGEILSFRNRNDYRAMNVHVYDIDKNFISYIYTNGTGDLIIPDNCYFIRGFCRETNTSDLTITRQAWKPIQLNSLPNGVCDEIIMKPNSNKAQLVQRVGKVVLDGSENWSLQTDFAQQYNTVGYSVVVENGFNMNGKDNNIISETYTPCNQNYLHRIDGEGITIGYGRCYIRSNVCETSANTITFKNYLQQNPITVYYELATPIIHEIQLKGYPHVYENGTATLNTDVPHQTLVSYNVNQEQLINTQNETIIRHDQQIDDLYYYIEMYLEEIYQMELFRMKLELSL